MKIARSEVILHIVGCLAFLALPYIFAPGGFTRLADVPHNPHERSNLLVYLLMLAFFYVNYYRLIPTLYFSRRYLVYGLSVVSSFAFILLLLLTIDRFDVSFLPIPNPTMSPVFRQKPPVGFELSHALFLFLVGVFASLALRINNQLRLTEREKLNTQLSYLKAQINPHFLFNTLNSIYSLAIEQSEQTPNAIVRLSALMRYVLQDSQQQVVLLSDELEYIRNYVALQQLRLDDTVRVNFVIEGQPNGRQIAPLLLMSFIENAFKYGVNPQVESAIDIRIQLDNGALWLEVKNRKVRVHHDPETSTGIGIENTRMRLQLLYPNRHRLTLHDNADEFKVELNLQLL